MPLPLSSVKILDPAGFVTSAFRLVVRAFLPVFLALYPLTAAAQSSAVYTIADVRVDETAESAAVARDIALQKGQAAAFRRLMERIVPIADRAKIPEVQGAQLLQLVSGLEVGEEKTSSVRYLAQMTVRFNASAVRNLLRNSGTRFAETKSKPLIVLPVYRAQATLQLWDTGNLWLKAWRDLPKSDGLINLIIPKGETADIAEISPEQALAGNDEQIQSIARRYEADGTLLTIATVTQAQGEKIVEVSTSRLGPGGADRTSVQSFASNKETSLQEILTSAVNNLRREIEETWKQDNLLHFDDHRELLAEATLRGLPGLIALQKKLEGVSLVQKAELVRLSLKSALIRLRYLGDPGQLRLALAQRDMALTQGAVYWKLQSSRR
ncbi:MAG: DUF2066 domain-containing protein [Alphaproteobacteria bacterium]|nr:DUF2066 domain-containing protein [Alphaproteobacteria bacterium]